MKIIYVLLFVFSIYSQNLEQNTTNNLNSTIEEAQINLNITEYNNSSKVNNTKVSNTGKRNKPITNNTESLNNTVLLNDTLDESVVNNLNKTYNNTENNTTEDSLKVNKIDDNPINTTQNIENEKIVSIEINRTDLINNTINETINEVNNTNKYNDTLIKTNITLDTDINNNRTQKSKTRSSKENRNINNTDKSLNLTKEIDENYNKTKIVNSSYFEDIENLTAKQIERDEDERLRLIWEDQVSNFTASDLLTFFIEGQDKEYFYEEVTSIPSLLTIAYFIDDGSKIDLFIYDNKNNLIHKVKKRSQYYFEFEAKEIGVYKFTFNNDKTEDKKITFAIHSGNNTDPSLSNDHIDHVYNQIIKVDKRIKEMKMKENFLIKKYEGHFNSTKKNNTNIVFYSILEMVIMIVIFMIQMIYLKYLTTKS